MENAIQKATSKQLDTTSRANQSVSAMLNTFLDKDGYRKRFDELLGARAPQFVSSIVSIVNADEKLQKAFRQAPITVIQAALKAATFDLPIDQNLGYAYIVPFNKTIDNDGNKRMEANFILGWKGMHQMALRSGVYKTISVVDVRQGEFRSYNRLTGDLDIVFEDDEGKRDSLPIVGYAGYYRLVNGAEKTIYMTKKQVDQHARKFSKAYSYDLEKNKKSSKWTTDFDAMALKTVYRQLIGKWGVMSIDYRTSKDALNLADQMAAEDTMFDEDVIDVENTVDNDDNGTVYVEEGQVKM